MLNFALPVLHNTAVMPTNEIKLGRAFHQNFDKAGHNNKINGLELFLPLDNTGSSLYAMLTGEAKYIRSERIVELYPTPQYNKLYRRGPGSLATIPKTIIYENIDESALVIALRALIVQEYLKIKSNGKLLSQNQWHEILFTSWNNNKLLHTFLDNEEVENGFNIVADNFVKSAIFIGRLFRINAGDKFANAAETTTETAPVGFPNKVIIKTKTAQGEYLNPAHYMRHFINISNAIRPNQKSINLISKINSEHSLIRVLGINITTKAIPSARATKQESDGSVKKEISLPDVLTNFHGYGESLLRWKYDPTKNLELVVDAKFVPGSTTEKYTTATGFAKVGGASKVYKIFEDCSKATYIPINICSNPTSTHINKINQIYNNYGGIINKSCFLLEVPVEIAITILAKESGGDAKAIRFEPLDSKPEESIRNEKALLAAGVSKALISEYKKLAGGKGDSVSVKLDLNDPNSLNSPIKSSKSNLTWGNLKEMLNIHDASEGEYYGLGKRISPGAVQTLVTTAHETIFKKLDSSELRNLNLVPPQSTFWDVLKWLIEVENSIGVSVGLMRQYSKYKVVGWDLLKICSIYNGGANKSQEPYRANTYTFINYEVKTKVFEPNIWGMQFNNSDYPREAIKYYNAVRRAPWLSTLSAHFTY